MFFEDTSQRFCYAFNYGREVNDLCDSDASTILKNFPTSSSGDNTVEGRILLDWMF